MSRRINIRRSGGGGGGGSGGGVGLATPEELLGSTLVIDLDARFGDSGANWTALTGQTFAGAGAPVLATDGVNFRGQRVWKYLLASAQRHESGLLPVIVPAGQQLYVSVIYRATSANAVTQVFVELNDVSEVGQALLYSAAGVWNVFMQANFTGAPPAADQLVHRAEFFLDAGFGPGEAGFVLDGNMVSGTGGINNVANAVRRVCVGAAMSTGNAPSDINIASVRVATIAPIFDPAGVFDPQKIYQQLRAYDAVVWGTS